MIGSRSTTPSRNSLLVVPVMPVFTGRNSATPLLIVNTPSFSIFFLLFFGSAGAARATPFPLPAAGFGSGSNSRMVSAWIGTVRTCGRIAVTIDAVQEAGSQLLRRVIERHHDFEIIR